MATYSQFIGNLTKTLKTGIKADKIDNLQEIGSYALSNEDFDSVREPEVKSNLATLEATVATTLNTVLSAEEIDKKSFTEAQFEAAKKIAALAANPVATLQGLTDLRNSDTKGIVISAEEYGAEGITDPGKLSLEAFDGEAINNAIYFSISYNFGAARQDEFGETLFPTIVIDPATSGFEITTEYTTLMSEFDRDTSGDAAMPKYKKIPLVKAIYDNDLFGEDKNKICAVVRDDNADKLLVDYSYGAQSNGSDVTTAPYKTGRTVSILGMSQTDATLSKGAFDQNDALDRTMVLERLYYNITTSDADGNATTDEFKVDTSMMPHAGFTYSTVDQFKQLSLTFDTDGIVLNTSTSLTALNTTSVALSNLPANYTFKIFAKVHGDSSAESSDTGVYPAETRLVEVRDDSGDLVPTTSDTYAQFAAAVDTMVIDGYTLETYRTNSNQRTLGQLIGYDKYTDIINVPLRTGVTVVTPTSNALGTDNAAGHLAAQIQACGIKTSIYAVKKVTEYAEMLRSMVVNNVDTDVKVTGIGRYNLYAYYNEVNLEVDKIISNLTSSDKLANLKDAIINQIKDAAIDMWLDSNYGVTYNNTKNPTSVKPTIILATDYRIKAYLGSEIYISDDYDVKIVASINPLVKGKIYMVFGMFGTDRNTVPNPLNFGQCAWAPTISTDVTRLVNGANVRVLNNMPRFLHIVNTPVMTVFNVSNINAALGKTAIDTHEV